MRDASMYGIQEWNFIIHYEIHCCKDLTMIDPQPTPIQYTNTPTRFACTHIWQHMHTPAHKTHHTYTIPMWVGSGIQGACHGHLFHLLPGQGMHSVSSPIPALNLLSQCTTWAAGLNGPASFVVDSSMLMTNCFVAQVSQHILHCTYACIDGQITHVGILEYCVLSKMWVGIKCILKSLACTL